MYHRDDLPRLQKVIKDGDSVLLLGPRQVGKTTLLHEGFEEALHFDFADPGEKLRYSQNPSLLLSEIRAALPKGGLFTIDEIQKVPLAFDALQVLLDDRKISYQAFLTGSSARKIKRGAVNTLPGRVLQWKLGPLSAEELGYYNEKDPSLRKNLLLSMMTRGHLPRVQGMSSDRSSRHLRSYVQTYLEQEILSDALTKDIGQFARFLRVAASRSGTILNFTTLSQESGASLNTIKHHVEVLVDTLTAYTIPGFSLSDTKSWLSTPKLLLFDLGVRNAAAERVIEEKALVAEYGPLFEQWVGLELVAWIRNREPPVQLYYWRSVNKEIDWVLKSGQKILAIEVKWTENWRTQDLFHLDYFRNDLQKRGYEVMTLLVCQTPKRAVSGYHPIIPPHDLVKTLEGWRRQE